MDVVGWAPGGIFLWLELVQCFRLIRISSFSCFEFQGCSGVLIRIKFGFNLNWGFLVIG